MIDSLSECARLLRRGMVHNYVDKTFLPDSTLATILQDFDLEGGLKKADVSPVSLRHEAREAIHSGGSKLFAILVLMQGHPLHLIEGILKTDQLTGRTLDSRLPFKVPELLDAFEFGSTHDRLENEDWAKEFCTLQWQLISPFFKDDRIHRQFRFETILPFTECNILPSAGAYADVYEVTLDGAHHGFGVGIRGIGPVKIARKELNYFGSDSYENESRILRLIRQLRHDNILHLLASYSIADSAGRWIHNLLFPLAEMTLVDLFTGSKGGGLVEYFGSLDNIYAQLYGLSSALENLHFYEDSEENLRLKGCHLDVAPRNILVHSRKLLLADFGLSRLRGEASKSCTPFKGDVGDFGAPECFDENCGPSYEHGSSSDIWSFGCILLVSVAFMLSGVDGVQNLRKVRRHTSTGGNGTAWRFHAEGKRHEGVSKWMKNAEHQVTDIQRDLLDLIARMLEVSPKLRVNAREVTTTLYILAQKSRYRTICETFRSFAKKHSSTKFQIEQERLVIWGAYAGYAVGAHGSNDCGSGWVKDRREKWQMVDILLTAACEEATLLLQTSKASSLVGPIFTTLHELNNGLEMLCPEAIRESILIELTTTVTSMYDRNINTLADLQVSNQEASPAWKRKATLLAAIKYMASRADSDVKDLRLDERDIRIAEDKSHSRSGPTYALDPKASTPLLCEWIEYDEHDMDKAPEKFYDRINRLANEFSIDEFASELGVLRCTGFFHSIARTAFGVLYAYPRNVSPEVLPTSLYRLMTSNLARPPLGTLFTMAQSVTQSVHSVHEVGWLHKSLNSHNLMFFDDRFIQLKHHSVKNVTAKEKEGISPSSPQTLKNAQKARRTPTSSSGGDSSWWPPWNRRDVSANSSKSAVESKVTSNSLVVSTKSATATGHSKEVLEIADFPPPYLTGFNHSRPNNPQTFTRGRTLSAHDYQHFQYLDDPRQRYRLGFDYYGVGLLLLEIGFWTPLNRSNFLGEKSIKDIPHAEQQQIWLKAVPQLGSIMGATYRDAVELCLNDTFIELDDEAARRGFDSRVVKPLKRCFA